MLPSLRFRVRPAFALLFLACLLFGGTAARAERLAQITLLHFNDIYEIAPIREIGGVAPLMTLIEQERRRSPHALLTFGGDMLSPSLLSHLTQGQEMLALCNTLEIDLAVLGNHEFDFGTQVLTTRIQESRFPWLASNLRQADGQPFPGTHLTAMREINGVKVGFIGLLTQSTATLASLEGQVTLSDPIATAKEWIPQLKQQGAEVIIALTHQSLAEDEALARGVQDLDVILGGHDHDRVVREVAKTLILKSAADGNSLAVADLTVLLPEPGEKGKRRIVANLHQLSTFRTPPHPTLQKRVEAVDERLQGHLSRVVGKTATELDSRESTVREKESSMGNLFADAIQKETRADAALLNGGSLRGNRLYPAGSPLTYGDIARESPFGNTVILLELSEQTLWEALEHGVAMPGQGQGRFPQVAGLSFTYDPRRPVGNRILKLSVGNQALQRLGTRIYRLGTNDYLARGGDGYRMLVTAKRLLTAEAGRPLSTVVMDFLNQQGTVSPQVEGRIVAVEP
ncbi:MAG: bifunctional metallophosphatase/5'-nucleotidase [Magnetococcales bacterium]|nr:bifunctional metallophosphatase/5'-nucleotidase [Magnetococcales bacterium]